MSFSLRPVDRRYSRLFRTESLCVGIDFLKDWSHVPANDVPQLHDTFEAIIEEYRQTLDSRECDNVRIAISQSALKTPIWLPFREHRLLKAEYVLQKVAAVLQSNEEFRLDQRMSMSICHVSPPDGRGSGRTNVKKRRLVTIKNADELCFQQAIAVAHHFANKQDTPEWEGERNRLQRRAGPHSWQTRKTEAFIDAVGGARQACTGMETWDLYARYLGEQGYQLNVFSRAIFDREIYRGTKYVTETPKHLHLHDRHYDVITSMPAFVERSYFCETFQVGYNHAEIHSCHVMCQGCKTMGPPCPPDPNTKTCYRCHRVFRQTSCRRFQSQVQYMSSVEEMREVSVGVGRYQSQAKLRRTSMRRIPQCSGGHKQGDQNQTVSTDTRLEPRRTHRILYFQCHHCTWPRG
ncbi:hypothetical protein SNE40_010904 [Patella caerulea]|uniref:Uncharacterized protein n=1 Tax=Patella caerulea TaxID=87958 RepID=A0AAN8PS62_PATCE